MRGVASFFRCHLYEENVAHVLSPCCCTGNEPVTLEKLKQLQAQAAHTQIIVPELDVLNNAVTKLAAFQVCINLVDW